MGIKAVSEDIQWAREKILFSDTSSQNMEVCTNGEKNHGNPVENVFHSAWQKELRVCPKMSIW